MYEASLARKSRTEEHLRSLGVPLNPNLPRIEDESYAKLRPPIEIAKRAIVLYCVSAVGFGSSPTRAVEWLKREHLWDSVSPSEKALLTNEERSQEDLANASWRIESLWVLLWCLGKIDSLDYPMEECDVAFVEELMPPPDSPCDEFLRNSTSRSLSDVLDETDLIYRIHWAVVEAQLHGEPMPASLNASVVYERHYALNWLVCYAKGWDDITTDT